MQAIWKGTVLAESDSTVVVEGNHYFPMASIRGPYLVPSARRSSCPWKGEANYFSIRVGEALNADAAWCYPDPRPDADHIRGYVAFWKGVKVVRSSEAERVGLLTRLADRFRR